MREKERKPLLEVSKEGENLLHIRTNAPSPQCFSANCIPDKIQASSKQNCPSLLDNVVDLQSFCIVYMQISLLTG